MKCKKCGGNRTKAKCNICELLGQSEPPGGQLPGGWPRESLALGVLPSQIPEAMEQSRKLGFATLFTNDGRAIITDPGHHRDYAKALGKHTTGQPYIDRDAFY